MGLGIRVRDALSNTTALLIFTFGCFLGISSGLGE